jgi:SAM-dependent methyltransferase
VTRRQRAGTIGAVIVSGKLRRVALGAAGAVVAAALWWRANPSACPYAQRFWVEAPHPLITRRRLYGVLSPRPGERVLEVGPGTGYYTVDVANWLVPSGQLDILDLQREMLDHTMRRVRERGLNNVTATQGDARRLPYREATFDAAFLVTVLGEIPAGSARRGYAGAPKRRASPSSGARARPPATSPGSSADHPDMYAGRAPAVPGSRARFCR